MKNRKIEKCRECKDERTITAYFCGVIPMQKTCPVCAGQVTKSKTEEIQYLGAMLSATTEIDTGRIEAIRDRLGELNRDEIHPKGCELMDHVNESKECLESLWLILKGHLTPEDHRDIKEMVDSAVNNAEKFISLAKKERDMNQNGSQLVSELRRMSEPTADREDADWLLGDAANRIEELEAENNHYRKIVGESAGNIERL